MPDMPQPQLSRRAALRLLAAATLGVLTGCRPQQRAADGPASSAAGAATIGPKGPAARAEAGPTANVVVQRAAAAERALLAAYDQTMLDHPQLAARLAPLRADHAAHLDGLVPGAMTPPAPNQPTPTDQPTPNAQPTPNSDTSAGPPVVESSVAGAAPSTSASPAVDLLAPLAALERSAAAARVDDVTTAGNGSLARLLASIGGCEAAHAALLSVSS